ncbi:MAG: hypothetical protein PHS17_08275 [Desulfobacterales bacterium]|nr:hypothetical protein [Desulfobacterales bacterium]
MNEKAGYKMRYIVDAKGNPTALIIPMDEYRRNLSVLKKVEDFCETRILSKSAEFKRLVKKGLEDIKAGRTRPWKKVWDDI